MKFLKSAKAGAGGFVGKFTNGATTDSADAAQFFMVMQDKDADLDELKGYISIGKMTNPSHDWNEISRIAATFAAA